MADYRVVLRIENPDWQENCPLQIQALQISRDTETAACYLQSRVLNIGNKAISAISLSGSVSAHDGTVESFEITSLDNHLLPGDSLPLPPFALKLTEPQDISAKICRVDNLENFGVGIQVPNAAPLAISNKAIKERTDILLKDGVDSSACNGTHEEYGDWWLCGCGALNYMRDRCHHCGVDKIILNDLEDETFLEEQADSRVIEKAESALSKNNRTEIHRALTDLESIEDARDLRGQLELKLEETEERTRKARKKAAAAVIPIAVIIIASATLFNKVIDPAIKRHNADELLFQQKYSKAEAIYKELGNDKLANKCEKLEAEQEGDEFFRKHDYEKAISRYTSCHATKKANKAKYAYAARYGNSSTKSLSYLSDLIDDEYPGAQDLYDELFGNWKIDVGFTTSEYKYPDNDYWFTWSDTSSWERSSDCTYIYALLKAVEGPEDGTLNLKVEAYCHYGDYASNPIDNFDENGWSKFNILGAKNVYTGSSSIHNGECLSVVLGDDRLYDGYRVKVSYTSKTKGTTVVCDKTVMAQ